MIYVTGDMHGEIARFAPINLPNSEKWTKDDYLIICGDFGFVFYEKGTKLYDLQQNQLDQLATLPFTICFCDGNHENFPLLFSYPEEDWHGGKIHRIRKNIIHLMRGHAFEIEGKTFYVMGGGYSYDRPTRILNKSYWEEELPNEDDYETSSKTLTKYNDCFDYIITHIPPDGAHSYIQCAINCNEQRLREHLAYIAEFGKFKKWFFGHVHRDCEFIMFDNHFRAICFDVVQLDE